MAKNFSGALLAMGLVFWLIALYFLYSGFAQVPDVEAFAGLYLQSLSIQLSIGCGTIGSIFVCTGAIAAQIARRED